MLFLIFCQIHNVAMLVSFFNMDKMSYNEVNKMNPCETKAQASVCYKH